MAAYPAVRPVRWQRLIFTYVIPVVPFAVAFDGVVSCLRTYTPEELLRVARVAGPEYDWEAGTEKGDLRRPPVTYLIGTPRGKGVPAE